MIIATKRISLAVSALGATLFHTDVFAGAAGTLVYAPVAPATAASSVPSLTGSMLIVMSLLLAAVAYRMFRQGGSNGSKFLLLLLGGGILVSGASGVKLISDAYAAVSHSLGNPAGGVEPISSGDNNIYTNTSGVDLRIQSVTPPAGCPNPVSASRCDAGDVLLNTEQCSVECTAAGGGGGAE